LRTTEADSFRALATNPVSDTVVPGGALATRAASMTELWSPVDDVAKHLGAVRDSISRCIEHRGLPAGAAGTEHGGGVGEK